MSSKQHNKKHKKQIFFSFTFLCHKKFEKEPLVGAGMNPLALRFFILQTLNLIFELENIKAFPGH
jgi:hypothetical protein